MPRRTLLPVALLTSAALSPAACGNDGGKSGGDTGAADRAAVRKIAQDGIRDAKTLCKNFAPAQLKIYGGLATCEKGAGNPKSVGDARVSEVTVTGDKASARVRASAGELKYELEKLDGVWKITATK